MRNKRQSAYWIIGQLIMTDLSDVVLTTVYIYLKSINILGKTENKIRKTTIPTEKRIKLKHLNMLFCHQIHLYLSYQRDIIERIAISSGNNC